MSKSLVRKVTYILAIIVLLLPLYAMGRPGSGTISNLRTRHELGEAYLGKLDPTSESMRLATLGLKGVASAILWQKADYYKEEKFFDRMSATLNQIALMQPHFISVWQHQAHNMSYNVSPEFEDYHQRYEWVKKGIDYLVRGTKYNQRKPILQYDLGHYVGNKIGKFDEKKQYRELFRRDQELHNYFTENGLPIDSSARGYDDRPDNWRVGKLWFDVAVLSYQSGNKIAKTPHLLYSYSPLWQMYYGEAMQTDGILDGRTSFAWAQAGREWADFGKVSIPWSGDGQIKLLESDSEQAAIDAANASLMSEMKDVIEKIKERRTSRIPADLKLAYEKPEKERTATENEQAAQVVNMLNVSLQEAIADMPRDQQPRLLQKSTELAQRQEKLRITNIYRSNVNYGYWEKRALAEQELNTVEARQKLFAADKFIDSAQLKDAVESYDAAWVLWNEALRKFPVLANEDVGDEILKSITRYTKITDSDIEQGFPLQWFVEFRKQHDKNDDSVEIEEFIKKWDADHESKTTPSGEKKPDESNVPTGEPAAVAPTTSDPTAPSQSQPPKSTTGDEVKMPEEPSPAGNSSPANADAPAPDSAPSVPTENTGLDRPPVLENPETPN